MSEIILVLCSLHYWFPDVTWESLLLLARTLTLSLVGVDTMIIDRCQSIVGGDNSHKSWRVREYCLMSYIDTGYYFCTLKHLFAFAVNRIRTKLLESEIFDWMQWMHVSYHPSHKERNPNVGFTLNNTVNVANYINYINYIHFRTIRVGIISSLSLMN